MFNEKLSQVGEFKSYQCIGSINIDTLNKNIVLGINTILEQLKDGVWTMIHSSGVKSIVIDDNVKINPETLSIDEENGQPGYTYLYNQFGNVKTMVETFVQTT